MVRLWYFKKIKEWNRFFYPFQALTCLKKISDGSLDDVEFPNISNQDGRGTISAHASGTIFDFEDPLSPSGPLANSLLTEKDFEIPSDSLEFHLADGTPIKEKEALAQIGK